jgi:hypothetical protein
VTGPSLAWPILYFPDKGVRIDADRVAYRQELYDIDSPLAALDL